MDDDNTKKSPGNGRRGRPSASAARPPGATEAVSTDDAARPTGPVRDDRSNGSEREPETTYSKQVRVASSAESGSGSPDSGTWDSALLEASGAGPTDGASIVVGSAEDFDLTFEDLAGQGSIADAGVPAGPATATARRGRTLFALPRLQIDDRLGRILLAILLSVLLWFYVESMENPTQAAPFTDLNIEVHGATGELKVVNNLPSVTANVQAPRNVLSRVSKSDIHPYINVKGLPEGVHDVPVEVDVNGAAAGELKTSLSPSSIQVQLDLQVSRVFTVTAEAVGAPAVGYDKGPVQITPTQLQVLGPKDKLDRIALVNVQMNVEGKSATQQGLEVPFALDSNGQQIKDLEFDPETLQVVAPIILLNNDKQVPVSARVTGQPAPGYGVSLIVKEPSVVTICCAPPNVLEPIQSLETRPVSIAGITTTLVTKAELVLPAGVKLGAGQPNKINVTVSVQALQITQRESVAISVDGLSQGLSAVLAPDTLDVILGGTVVDLQKIGPNDVRAVVSAQGRGPGSYQVKPEVSAPKGVTIESTSPETVTLTLIAPTAVPTHTPIPSPTRTPTAEAIPSETQVPPTAAPTSTPPAPTGTPQAFGAESIQQETTFGTASPQPTGSPP